MGRAKRVGKAYVRGGLYGSTRYTSKGARNPSRSKTYGLTAGGHVLGAFAGGAAGAVAGPVGSAVGFNTGAAAGAAYGRKIAREKGYVRRTKKRMTVRKYNAYKAKK